MRANVPQPEPAVAWPAPALSLFTLARPAQPVSPIQGAVVLPGLTGGWSLVPGSALRTVAQQFARYRNERGEVIRSHVCRGLGAAIERPRLARFSRDGRQITVHRAGGGFEARWEWAGDLFTVAGELSLAAFLTVVYGLDFGPAPARGAYRSLNASSVSQLDISGSTAGSVL